MSAFADASKRAAAAFLQTVVVVDNMASYDSPADNAAAPPGELTLVPPDPFVSAEEAEDERIADSGIAHPLDAGVVSRAFAGAGLVCSILRPTTAENLEEEVIQASARADILVLDWHMDDYGTLATRIIHRLIEVDEVAGGRLRLIAIYSGKSPLAPIRDELAEAYPKFVRVPDTVALACGNTKVVFLTKAESSSAPQEADLCVAPENLPDRLIEEFAKFAGGLLPNATLAAIAGLRQHTHRVLARFDKDLDGPFLTHRTLLPIPGDAEQFAADLILAELDAQVPIERIVSDYMGAGNVRDYFEHRMEGGLRPGLMLDKNGGQVESLELNRACRLVEEGIGSLADNMQALAAKVGSAKHVGAFKEALKGELHERLYLLADDDIGQSREDHARFAVRTKLKRDASSVRPGVQDTYPKLRLGALLESNGTFWICLTPYCDSTRVPPLGGRFLLAQLDENEGQFDLVVPDGAVNRKLAILKKRTNLITLSFVPDGEGNVRAIIDGNAANFESLADELSGTTGTRFRWLGELKSMHAVRFIQAFAGNLARVGLDDFEWHRLRQRQAED